MIGGAPRDVEGNLRSNLNFPDMEALADYVHSQGLKIGIYISPGPLTCGGFEGSYQHEAQDAHLFAQWGYDLLKYDLCSYQKLMKNTNDPAELKPPYQLMGSELAKQNRDFVYNLCEYGNGDVWKWGREVGGNFWRTTGDVGYLETPQKLRSGRISPLMALARPASKHGRVPAVGMIRTICCLEKFSGTVI